MGDESDSVKSGDEANQMFAVANANVAADSWRRGREFAALMGAKLPQEAHDDLAGAIAEMIAVNTSRTKEEVLKMNLLDLFPEGSDAHNALTDLLNSMKKPDHS